MHEFQPREKATPVGLRSAGNRCEGEMAMSISRADLAKLEFVQIWAATTGCSWPLSSAFSGEVYPVEGVIPQTLCPPGLLSSTGIDSDSDGGVEARCLKRSNIAAEP